MDKRLRLVSKRRNLSKLSESEVHHLKNAARCKISTKIDGDIKDLPRGRGGERFEFDIHLRIDGDVFSWILHHFRKTNPDGLLGANIGTVEEHIATLLRDHFRALHTDYLRAYQQQRMKQQLEAEARRQISASRARLRKTEDTE